MDKIKHPHVFNIDCLDMLTHQSKIESTLVSLLVFICLGVLLDYYLYLLYGEGCLFEARLECTQEEYLLLFVHILRYVDQVEGSLGVILLAFGNLGMIFVCGFLGYSDKVVVSTPGEIRYIDVRQLLNRLDYIELSIVFDLT